MDNNPVEAKEDEENELTRLPVGTPGKATWVALTDDQRRKRQHLADKNVRELQESDWFHKLGPAAQKTFRDFPASRLYICKHTSKPLRIMGIDGDGEQALCFFSSPFMRCYRTWLPTSDLIQVSKYTEEQAAFITELLAPAFFDPLGAELLRS